MVPKYSIASATVFRYLSKFGKQPQQVASLSPSFELPKQLWNRVRESPNDEMLKTDTILPALFTSSRTSQEKAVAGYLMQEHGLKLEVHKEKEYILSLIACGLVPLAIETWQQRKLGHNIDEPSFVAFLITIYCRSHRVRDAERLIQDKDITPGIALEFLKAYSQIGNDTGVDRWTTALIESFASYSINKSALRSLVHFKKWHSAQHLMEAMTERDQVVPSDVSAACVLAARHNATEASVASVLSRDGAVVNSSRLKLALGDDPRRKVSLLLKKKLFDKALDVLERYNGHHELALCCQLLNSQQALAKFDKAQFLKRMTPVYERAEKSQRDGRYAQFMLTYHYACRDYNELWNFISKYELSTPAPLISPMSLSNYHVMWRAVLSAVKEKQATRMPFTLRGLLVATLSRIALTQRLLRLMAVSLYYAGDLQGLVTLLEFAAEKSGIEADGPTLSTLFPNQPPRNKDWRNMAELLCQNSFRDFSEVKLSAEPLRNELWVH